MKNILTKIIDMSICLRIKINTSQDEENVQLRNNQGQTRTKTILEKKTEMKNID